MPRPHKTQGKRSERLTPTRVTPEELAAIKEKAAEAGLTLSEYQRRALLDCYVIVRGNVVDAAAVRQLSAIGNNLNQLTRKAHIHDDFDRARLHDVLTAIDDLIMGLIE